MKTKSQAFHLGFSPKKTKLSPAANYIAVSQELCYFLSKGGDKNHL